MTLLFKEQEKWQSIRNTYLLEDLHGYNKGNFTEEEKLSAAKLLMDMTSRLDKMKEHVYTKHEVFCKNIIHVRQL